MKKIMNSLIFAGLLLVACNSSQKQSLENAGDDMENFADQVSADFQKEWNDLTTSLEDYDRRLDRKLEEVSQRLDAAGEDASEDLKETKENLQAWSKQVKKKLEMSKQEAAEDWNAFKKETKEYFTKLDKALDDPS